MSKQLNWNTYSISSLMESSNRVQMLGINQLAPHSMAFEGVCEGVCIQGMVTVILTFYVGHALELLFGLTA
jgi:hypothetical protein